MLEEAYADYTQKLDAEACSSGERNLKEIAGKVGYKYDHGHMRLIAEQQLMPGQSKSQIMIDEWKTSGKSNERPTVGVLLQLLIQAEIYSAADHVAEKFLNGKLRSACRSLDALSQPCI